MTKRNSRLAKSHNEEGVGLYENWEMASAIKAFKKAAATDPDNPEYHLNLARAHARSGDFAAAMAALGKYLQTETNASIAERYEWLFSTSLDDVEAILIERMPKLGVSVPIIGKAMQMWLEYRITVGRRPLRLRKPELWAAAIAYSVIKINFIEKSLSDVAKTFRLKDPAIKKKYNELVETLDLMPADYRYFVGDDNPLDKLVEVAHLLETLDRRFQDD